MRNREVQIKFYATEKERESIRRNAKRAGMKMGEYARAVLTSDDVSIKVIDTEPLKKAAHELVHEDSEHLWRECIRPGRSETRFGERGLVVFRNHGSARGASQGSRPEQYLLANRGLRQPR